MMKDTNMPSMVPFKPHDTLSGYAVLRLNRNIAAVAQKIGRVCSNALSHARNGVPRNTKIYTIAYHLSTPPYPRNSSP